MLKYIYAMIFGAALSFFLTDYFMYQSSLELQLKYDKLVEQSQSLQKEIDRLKKEVNNIQVPDLKEDEVVDYWKEFLK